MVTEVITWVFWLEAVHLRPSDVYGGCIKGILDVRRIELLYHFNRGTTVFGDLINICTFHEAKTDIGVA